MCVSCRIEILRVFPRAWNKGTQSWLAFYVHKRLPQSMDNQVTHRVYFAPVTQNLFPITYCSEKK